MSQLFIAAVINILTAVGAAPADALSKEQQIQQEQRFAPQMVQPPAPQPIIHPVV